MKSFEKYYFTAHENILLIHHAKPAVLQVVGPDSLDLLNRMSTNNLLPESPTRVLKTVFTNANARIIDIVSVIPEDQGFLLLCSHDTPTILREWLSGYIFFQDDVHLIESTVAWELYDFVGPKARGALNHIKQLIGYSGEDLLQIEGNYLWADSLGTLPRYRLFCHGNLAREISSPGQRFLLPVQNETLTELLRIEAGQPAMGSEITQDSIPLEVGLWDHISFSKGCYIGQEIIARMESRRKLARMLVGIRSKEELKVGTSIQIDDGTIGVITSYAMSPRLGWIGLALVKPGSWNETTPLSVGGVHDVQIRPLPFE
jgi:folate-binding protein YgfZ